MRKNIEKLIASGVTAYRVSKETGIALNTATRIFSGEAKLDNITLKNAEILNDYYLSLNEYYLIEDVRYKKDDKGNYNYDLINIDRNFVATTDTCRDEETLREIIQRKKNQLSAGEGFTIEHIVRNQKGEIIVYEFKADYIINYSQLKK